MLRNTVKKYKAEIVSIGDIIIFAASLLFTIAIRYPLAGFFEELSIHEKPFFFMLILWIVVFYIADLYNYTSWRSTIENGQRLIYAILINFLLSMGLFYSFGNTIKITPKINLVIFTLIFGIIDSFWRFSVARALSKRRNMRTIFMLSSSPLSNTIIEHCGSNPELGYEIRKCNSIQEIQNEMEKKSGCGIIVDNNFLKDPGVIRFLYDSVEQLQIYSLVDFYEKIFRRVPLAEIEEIWFINEIENDKNLLWGTKRVMDILLTVICFIIFSPFFVLFSAIILLTSRGPIFYRQTRTGKNGKLFTLYKFRTMFNNPEKNPDSSGKTPTWWSDKNDSRVTRFGKFLRYSHLDELPQLINILKGELSFVGPRPERPEFFGMLKEQIPHYSIRQIIKPGLTGWAQINYNYGGSVEGTLNKLEYDIYYMKHESLMLDILILLKTILKIFKK